MMFLKRISLLREGIETEDRYPFNIQAFQKMDTLELTKDVTFFVGENGSGKSTLLEAIAEKCEFNPAGGGRNNQYDVYRAAEAGLADHLRLSWMPKVTNGFFMRAESFYHFATHIDEIDADQFQSYGGRSLHEQSHGESFLSLFLNRFNGRALYLLDEPEAALSPQRQLTFLRVLHELTTQENCQFIIATHSPILLGYPNASILSFDNGDIREIAYEMTDHYRITKNFLDHREKMLNELLEDEEDFV